MNVCPVCRNVNQRDATICRYCGTTLTPPAPDAPAAAPRRRVWPWVTSALALVLVLGVTGFTFLALSGGESAASGITLEVGTDDGAALQFDPQSVTAPPQSPVNLVFTNDATVPHNLIFAENGPIDAGTSQTVAPQASETLSFTTPEPGSYPFTCTIHPGMDGTLVVE
jgi:plastocyanin